MNKMKITVRGIKDEMLKEEVKAIIREFCDCEMFVSDGVRAVWRNNIKFSRMYTLQEIVVFTIVVLKGEENEV